MSEEQRLRENSGCEMTAWDYPEPGRDRLTRDLLILTCGLAVAAWAALFAMGWAIYRLVIWLGGA